jgi:hypothetical protein
MRNRSLITSSRTVSVTGAMEALLLLFRAASGGQRVLFRLSPGARAAIAAYDAGGLLYGLQQLLLAGIWGMVPAQIR